MGISHVPVMLEEVLKALKVKKSGIYVDGTVGLGGHAEGILGYSGGGCKLICIDRDGDALEAAKKRLKSRNAIFIRDNFSNMDTAVEKSGYRDVDGILLDLGVSALQLQADGRGFSFLKDDLLDMRMDRSQALTALRIVNDYPEKDLAYILWQYGEERFSRRIARAIVASRSQDTIRTCRELARIVERVLSRGGKRSSYGRIHPATRTFQALRIEVNRELSELSMAVEAGIRILKSGGRFCVLSYHSLEDRIVKHSFRDMARSGLVHVITKKPIVPKKEERNSNPSSRSAKLRIAEKV
jgi:16S rRNA (cytosine1402-N4)-methyltransferase